MSNLKSNKFKRQICVRLKANTTILNLVRDVAPIQGVSSATSNDRRASEQCCI